MSKATNIAGIYLIRHTPSGLIYVGQANNIRKRWGEHKRQLNSGDHHNKRLQELWKKSSPSDFEFEVLKEAPSGLSALQLQRWLVKEERRAYSELKEQGISINEVEPEIVATRDAEKEYHEERKRQNKQHDQRISAKRREIKKLYQELERQIQPQAQRLEKLMREYHQKSELIRNSTGWRRIFHGRPPGFNVEKERKVLEGLVAEINRISPNVKSVQDEIYRLKEEYRKLYGQFTKVSERRWNRTLWYGLGRLPSQPNISE